MYPVQGKKVTFFCFVLDLHTLAELDVSLCAACSYF